MFFLENKHEASGVYTVNQSMIMSVTTDLYLSYLVRRISKIKCHPLPQKLPVWADFLRLEANETLLFPRIMIV